jgi:hypothetical protein
VSTTVALLTDLLLEPDSEDARGQVRRVQFVTSASRQLFVNFSAPDPPILSAPLKEKAL